MQFFSLKNASEQVIERLFLVMTICLLVPLYFEEIRHVFVLVFFLLLGFLGFNLKHAQGNVSKTEKTWLAIMLTYALVFILSFVLRGNYTEDGSWRLEAPLFILVFSLWYYFSIRFSIAKSLLKFSAISSLSIAVLLLGYEVWTVGKLGSVQFGAIHRDIGATGFFMPITFALLSVLAWQKRSVVLILLVVASLLLTSLVGSRTALVMTVFPILMLIIHLFRSTFFSFKLKSFLLVLAIVSIGVLGYFSKAKITATMDSYQAMENGEFYTSMGIRMAMLDMGGALWAKNWVLGVGPSHYKTELAKEVQLHDYSEQIKQSATSYMHIHNQYLMDGLLHGLAGLVALGLFLLSPLRVFYKNNKLDQSSGAFFVIGLSLGVLVAMFFGAIFTYTYTTVMYVLAMSALISHFESKKGNES